MKKIFLAIVLAIGFSAFANAQSEGVEEAINLLM